MSVPKELFFGAPDHLQNHRIEIWCMDRYGFIWYVYVVDLLFFVVHGFQTHDRSNEIDIIWTLYWSTYCAILCIGSTWIVQYSPYNNDVFELWVRWSYDLKGRFTWKPCFFFLDGRAMSSCRKAKPVAATVFTEQMMTQHWRCLCLFCEAHPNRVSVVDVVVIGLEEMEVSYLMYVIVRRVSLWSLAQTIVFRYRQAHN